LTTTLRLATIADIPDALQLCRSAGWNQLEQDWVRLLEYEPDGCFAAEVDGKLVGTVTTTCYGTELAWIGMMLVDPDFRRRGIATSLMNRSLEYLAHRAIRCIKLDATPEGSHVYERLGFRTEWTMRRWMREGTATEGTESGDAQSGDAESSDGGERPHGKTRRGPSGSIDPSILKPYLEMDRRAFGVDRGNWLLQLLGGSTVRTHSSEPAGSIDDELGTAAGRGPGAIGMLRRGFLASYLGPLIVADLSSAARVVHDLLRCTSEPVFWDIPEPNHRAVALAEQLNFQPVRHLTRMWTGSYCVRSDLERLFALADPSTG
jgi:GNAT superfamily N-acetyltransferase